MSVSSIIGAEVIITGVRMIVADGYPMIGQDLEILLNVRFDSHGKERPWPHKEREK